MTVDTLHAAYSRTKWSLILRGVLGLAVGFLILARPAHALAALAVVVAFWALIDGVINIARGFAVRGKVPHWGWIVFMGVVGVLFGGAALYYMPTLSLAFIVSWIALWLLISGATAMYVAVQEKRLGLSWGWTMVFGAVAVLGSILAFSHPGTTLAWLIGFIAAFAIIEGIAMLIGAARLGSAKRKVEHAVDDMRADKAPRDQDADKRDRGNRAA